VLRRRWGFEGFVVSDFIFGLRDARRALAAGLDVEMPFRHLFWDAFCRASLDPALIERAALRVLTTQLRFSDVGEPARYAPALVACDAHRTLARDVAARATVLLQNKPVRGTPLLPLDGSRVTKLAVVGRLAAMANLGDRGSSNVRAPSPVTVLDGLRAALPRASVRYDDGRDLARARDLARDADVVVLTAGLSYRDEGEHIAPTAQLDLLKMFRFPPLRELPAIVRAAARRPQVHNAGDRTRLTLHPHDETLIAAVVRANPATIVVLMGGSALITEAWRHQVPTVLMAWYPGLEGGHAIADVLLGRAEPGGRLPSVWPRSEAGLPFFDRNARHIRYDNRLGQRALDAQGIDAAFSLAHGLTYTHFRQTLKGIEARGDDGVARVVVENIGPRRGSELVTVWRHVNGAPSRLAGFARVVLDSGEAKTVDVVVPLPCDAENLHLARRSVR
jgi:beta-glucosidase